MTDDIQREWEENRAGLSAQLYDKLGARDHFIGAFRNVIDWSELAEWMTPFYRGKVHVGHPAHDPSVLLRMLFLSYLYPMSEEQVEELARDHIAVKYFLDLYAIEPPPDSDALAAFRDRIIRGGHWDLLQRVYEEILRKGRDQGVVLGTVYVRGGHVEALERVTADGEELKGKESYSLPDSDVEGVVD